MKLGQRIVVIAVASPLIVAVLAVAAFVVDEALDKRDGISFEKVAMGASESYVVSLLGRPSTARPCGMHLWADGVYIGKNDGRCVTEVRYEHFLSAWGIGYSADGHVVSKYHYVSE